MGNPYLAKLHGLDRRQDAEFPKITGPQQLTKPTEPPFVSFVGDQGSCVFEKLGDSATADLCANSMDKTSKKVSDKTLKTRSPPGLRSLNCRRPGATGASSLTSNSSRRPLSQSGAGRGRSRTVGPSLPSGASKPKRSGGRARTCSACTRSRPSHTRPTAAYHAMTARA